MNKMKELRLKHGYTQQKFAELLDVSRSVVEKWETGVRNPGRRSKKDIKKILKEDIDALFAEVE
jgi:DNA-binding XRE family transcriptional regulator